MTAETAENLKAYLTKQRWIFNLSWDEEGIFRPFYENPEARCIEFPFPTRPSEISHLAVTLPLQSEMDNVQWSGGTLVYSDWGIWEQRANLAGYQMIERIRASFGELRPFSVVPVNEFRADEQLLLANFILAALVYGWDACYIPNYRGWFAFVSHDEWGCIVTERDEDFKSIAEPLLRQSEKGYRIVDSPRFCRPAKTA